MDNRAVKYLLIFAHLISTAFLFQSFMIGNAVMLTDFLISLGYMVLWIAYVLYQKKRGFLVVSFIFWVAVFIISILALLQHQGIVDADTVLLPAVMIMIPFHGLHYIGDSLLPYIMTLISAIGILVIIIL